MAEYATNEPMKASPGKSLEHPVTDAEATRSVLVQGLPLLDQELTESSIVQVFSAYGEISKLLLQTHDSSKSQRAVVVFKETEAAVLALQANGRDILGANCTVSLASTMPTLSDGALGGNNVSDQADSAAPATAGGQPERPVTAAEWLRRILAQGMVYTRLFDEKLHVSETAKALAAKARAFNETHNVSGRVAAAATTASVKAREVDTRLGVSETAQRWARSAKESTDKALENPRVAEGVQQTSRALNTVVRQVSGLAQQALDGARGTSTIPGGAASSSTSASGASVPPKTTSTA